MDKRTVKAIKAIVIREVKYGEADKLLNILTRDHGLLTVTAKRASRPKSNMLYSTSPVTFTEFELSGTEARRFYVNKASVIEAFMNIKNDVELLTYAAHLCDLVLDTAKDIEESREIYSLLLYTLNKLNEEGSDPRLIVHTFELKLLFILGFTPVLNECVICGSQDYGDSSKLDFSFTQCGLVCSHKHGPRAGDTVSISKATYQCLNYIADSDIPKIFSYSLSQKACEEVYQLASRYTQERLEKAYTKLKFLEEL